MNDIIMSNSAKAVVLNATLHAEQAFIETVRRNARLEKKGKLSISDKLDEHRDKSVYKSLYRLCCNLGLGDLYDDWREDPEYDDKEEEQ